MQHKKTEKNAENWRWFILWCWQSKIREGKCTLSNCHMMLYKWLYRQILLRIWLLFFSQIFQYRYICLYDSNSIGILLGSQWRDKYVLCYLLSFDCFFFFFCSCRKCRKQFFVFIFHCFAIYETEKLTASINQKLLLFRCWCIGAGRSLVGFCDEFGVNVETECIFSFEIHTRFTDFYSASRYNMYCSAKSENETKVLAIEYTIYKI